MNIAGKIALVTGANRGIGASIATALLAAGAARVYAGTRTASTTRSGSTLVPVALDVTDSSQIERAVRDCEDVQILVNNAGIALGQSLLSPADPLAAEREMRVNYFGTLAMCRAFAPVLGRNGGGAIVNVLSILGRVSMPQIGSYAASKAAAFSLTQAVRAELAAQGTLVIGVTPAFVDTDLARRVSAPKLLPAAIAARIVEALQDGIEDVYPGLAAEIAASLLNDPKGVERQFATLLSRATAPAVHA
ncbi:MAG TPA: SDR family oxidoreductase [Burkholderiaceae bacterium]|nr:SDR family oxidoreductase [Burkholderiaceae bacterium]